MENADPSKQANEVIFSRKTNNSSHHDSNIYPHHKHLSIVLDPKLYFKILKCLKYLKILKCNKLIDLIRRL